MSTSNNIPLPELLQQGHPFRQWKTWTIPGTQLAITGYSRSNDKTFFHLPGLRSCIDAALCEGRQPDHVFLTHTHNDHSADLEFLAGKDGVQIFVPEAARSYVEAYIRAKRELNHVAPFNPELAGRCTIHGVKENDTFTFGKKGRYQVRIARCIHKVPCVGYCFSEQKSRLKPEFEALKREMAEAGQAKEFGKLMGQKRKEGIEVKETIWEPLFAFLGDTHPSVFEHNPWLFEYPVIFTECTFLNESEAQRAEDKGHTLWSRLKPTVLEHPENVFVLTHFSLRHSDKEVIQFFEKELQESEPGTLQNIVLWASQESHLPEQHQKKGT